MLGRHMIKTYSRQQRTIALSSAEAELYALVAASAEALGMQAYAADLGMSLTPVVRTDATAALGIAQRRGLGKVRHIQTQALWVQQAYSEKTLGFEKVPGTENPSDILTKHVPGVLLDEHLARMGLEVEAGRASSAPTLSTLSRYRSSTSTTPTSTTTTSATLRASPSRAPAVHRGPVCPDWLRKSPRENEHEDDAAETGVSNCELSGVGSPAASAAQCSSSNPLSKTSSLRAPPSGGDTEARCDECKRKLCVAGRWAGQPDVNSTPICFRCALLHVAPRRPGKSVCFNEVVNTRVITPYSEIYGVHPRGFDFPRHGRKVRRVPSAHSAVGQFDSSLSRCVGNLSVEVSRRLRGSSYRGPAYPL